MKGKGRVNAECSRRAGSIRHFSLSSRAIDSSQILRQNLVLDLGRYLSARKDQSDVRAFVCHRDSARGITPDSAEIGMVPKSYIKLSGQQAQQMIRLIDTLEEQDDVQHVYSNFDVDEKELQASLAP